MRRGRRPWLWLLVVACGALVAGGALAGCDARSRPSVVGGSLLVTSAGLPTGPSATGPASKPGAASASASLVSSGGSTPTMTAAASLSATPWHDTQREAFYPEAAAKEDVAIHVIEQFFAGVNYELDTNDETLLRGVVRPDCENCLRAMEGLHALHKNGQVSRGGHYHLVSVDQIWPVAPSVVEVRVTGSRDPGELLSASGQLLSSYPVPPNAYLQFFVDVRASPPVILQYAAVGPA
jgi:hypothetical protein